MRKKYKATCGTPEYSRERRRTIHGLLSQAYRDMKMRCEGRRPPNKAKLFVGLEYPTREEFLGWARNDKGFVLCYKQWVLSGYNKRLTPVVSRMDTTRGYVLDNIEYLPRHINASMVRSTYNRVQELAAIRRLVNADKR